MLMMEFLLKAKPGKIDSSTELAEKYSDSVIVEPNDRFDSFVIEPDEAFDSSIGKSNKQFESSEVEPRKYFSIIEPNQQLDTDITLDKSFDFTTEEPNTIWDASKKSSLIKEYDLSSEDAEIQADSTVKRKNNVQAYLVPGQWANYTGYWYCGFTLLLYFIICCYHKLSLQYLLERKQPHVDLKL